MNYLPIIDYYYPPERTLRRILLVHSRQVASRCLHICEKHPELGLDAAFLEAAAMLHDIGICRCNAPSIQCYGTEPYILHGVIGGQLLRTYHTLFPDVIPSQEYLSRLVRVCERHTGTGLTRDQILSQRLPLDPDGHYEPVTLSEQVVCYADKFYSKTHLDKERSVAETARSLERFGAAGVRRFLSWAEQFE
ncbi:MAG: HD domain-containing protein [Prevotella sp.]|nr:HD domain-containing protein [Prevotella sp.]